MLFSGLAKQLWPIIFELMTRPLSRHGAFALTEVLTVIGIVAVLAAITFTLVPTFWSRSRETALISNMRQIGIAAELYAQTHGLERVLSPRHLIESEMFPAEFLAAHDDGTKSGWFNDFVKKASRGNSGYASRAYNVKNSFFAMGDVFRNPTQRSDSGKEKVSESGWLVCFKVPREPSSNFVESLIRQPFHRLNFDGSVVLRPSASVGGEINFDDWYVK